MNRYTLAALAVAVALPCAAQAENFEVIAIGNADENGSNFYMLSLRTDLGFSQFATGDGSERNAQHGLRLRFDLAGTSYDTNYNGVDGTGSGEIYRLLLSYGMQINPATTVTVTGGVSYHSLEVRPVTLSSPDDSAETGYFASIDLEYSPEGMGSLQLLAEHDDVGSDYASVTYLANIGANLRIGPTANYVADGDYSRSAVGLSAIYSLGEEFEIKATVANAVQKITGSSDTDVDYVEVQLRTVF